MPETFTSDKKRICFLLDNFQSKDFYGGREKFSYKLINEFINSKSWLIDIICNNHKEKTVLDGINKIINSGNLTEISDLKAQYDIIITDGIIPAVINNSIIPDYAFLHDFSFKHMRKSFSLFKKFKYHFFPKHLKRIKAQEEWIKKYKKIFVVSNKIKQDIIENFSISPDKIFIIHPGLDANNTEYSRIFPDKVFNFGLIAPDFKIKGGYILLKALNLLRKQKYKFKVLIINSKQQKSIKLNFLIRLFKLNSFIEFIPKQKDLDSFYKNIDALCVPSFIETFGMVVLEGMSYALPIITGSSCGASEIILHEKNGLVFNAKNSADLAEQMKNLLNNKFLYEEISQNALITSKNYNWKNVFKALTCNFNI